MWRRSPPPRERRRWSAAAIYFVAICGLLFLLSILWLQSKWVGYKQRRILFSVHSGDKGSPIANAAIVVFKGYTDNPGWVPEPDDADAFTQHVLTDRNGGDEMGHTFRAYGSAYGTSSFSFDTGWVNFNDRFVRVTADDFEPLLFHLGERIGQRGDIRDNSPIVLDVKLKPAHRSENSGRPLTGHDD